MKNKQCIWKQISQKETHLEGELKNCYLYCDGYNFSCNNYVSLNEVAKIQVENGLQRFEHRKVHALEKGFEWRVLS